MKVRELSAALNQLFPLTLQESYDNAGPQVEWSDHEVSGILLALDADAAVIDEARRRGVNYIITHHPVFFKPVRRLVSDDAPARIVMEALAGGITLYAAHTNLDAVYADRLTRTLGYQVQQIIFRHAGADDREYGYGILAQLEGPQPLKTILRQIAERLGLEFLMYTGDTERIIRSLAILNGAGASVIERVLAVHAVDCVITGDVGYHQAKYARDCGIALIDAGHFGTEIGFMKILHDELVDYLTKRPAGIQLPVHIAESQFNPLRLYQRP